MSCLNVRTKSGILIKLSRNYFQLIHSCPVDYWNENLRFHHLIKRWKIGLKYFELYMYRGEFVLYEFDYYQIQDDFLKRQNLEGLYRWVD